MVAIFDDFEQFKRDVNRVQREYDQTVGAFQQMKKELKEKFNCDSIKEGSKLHEEMSEQELQMSKEYTDAFGALKEEFGDRLDRID